MAEAKKESKSKKAKVAKVEKEIKEAEVVAEAVPLKKVEGGELRVESKERPKATAKAGNASTSSAQGAVTLAKAGKRSAKAIKEEDEKEAKETRKAGKAKSEAAEEVKKPAKKPTRPKVERAGKKFREAAKLIEKDKVYTLAEALELATKTSPTKFDATVELHINLGVDPRQADQNVRGTVGLPEGTGKSTRVAVITEADDEKTATEAGADLVGADKIFANLDKEQIEFDILIATPNMMPKLAKYARMLGPKGLMPNPKSGTVTTDVEKAVKEAKAGKVEYRVDSAGIIHLGIGKVSFGADKLATNANVVINAVKAAKPASLKGVYIQTTHVSTTMGPSIKVQL
jgi:large subunit ribosomal protein L1